MSQIMDYRKEHGLLVVTPKRTSRGRSQSQHKDSTARSRTASLLVMKSSSAIWNKSDNIEFSLQQKRGPPPMISRAESAAPVQEFTSWHDLLHTRTTSRNHLPLSSIPSFVEFAHLHKQLALKLTGTEHIPNLLQGGKAAGPLAKSSTTGQVVRVLAAYPGNLTARPRHDVDSKSYRHDDLSWIQELLQPHLFSTIQEEVYRGLIASDGNDVTQYHVHDDSVWESLRTRKGKEWSDGTGWSHIAMLDNFEVRPAVDLFPQTFAILQNILSHDHGRIRWGPRLVAIARQTADSGIPNHYDYMNYMLTLHLPLFVANTAKGGPSDSTANYMDTSTTSVSAGMVVDGVRRDWHVGEPVVMDTTYEHATFNESQEKDMYLLLVDFWHPDLSNDEIDAIRTFLQVNSGV